MFSRSSASSSPTTTFMKGSLLYNRADDSKKKHHQKAQQIPLPLQKKAHPPKPTQLLIQTESQPAQPLRVSHSPLIPPLHRTPLRPKGAASTLSTPVGRAAPTKSKIQRRQTSRSHRSRLPSPLTRPSQLLTTRRLRAAVSTRTRTKKMQTQSLMRSSPSTSVPPRRRYTRRSWH